MRWMMTKKKKATAEEAFKKLALEDAEASKAQLDHPMLRDALKAMGIDPEDVKKVAEKQVHDIKKLPT